MTHNTHTPGPWEANGVHIECNGDTPSGIRNEIAVVARYGVWSGGDSPYNNDRWKANARLIAASPLLLEALYSILNIEGPAIQGGQLGAFHDLDVAYHFEIVRQAIAKAEGRG